MRVPKGAILDYRNHAQAHLMDRRYDGVLSESERALREVLKDLVKKVKKDTKDTPAWAEVEALIKRFGG